MPGYNRFVKLVQHNYFRDSPVTTDDIKRAIFIYGKETALQQGKTVRQRSIPITVTHPVPLPRTIKDFHSAVPISIDIMLIQSIPMLTSISGTSYQFRTVEPIFKTRPSKSDLLQCVKNVLQTYANRGIKVTQINGDNEFECLRGETGDSTLNIVAAEEHVGDIERSIRTIKEGTRTAIHALPFSHYTRTMVSGLTIKVVQGLNELPSDSGVSDELSPQTLVMGSPSPSYSELTELNYGDYVQTAMGQTGSTTESRTVGAIALFPSRNSSKSWYFMSLSTGYIIHRYSWEKLPATDDVIRRVKELAEKQKQPRVSSNFKYEWTKGREILELPGEQIHEEDQETNSIENEEIEATSLPHIDRDGTITAAIDSIRRSEQEDERPTNHGEQDAITDDSTQEEIEEETNQNHDVEQPPEPPSINEINQVNIPITSTEQQDIIVEEQEDGDDEPTPTHDTDDGLRSGQSVNNTTIESDSDRPRRSRPDIDYRAWHNHGRKQMMQRKSKNTEDQAASTTQESSKRSSKVKDMYRGVLKIVMAQIKAMSDHENMSIKQGIKRYGNFAVESVLAEYGQMKDKSVFKPRYANKLTQEEKRNSLNLITFMKKKRSGKLKTRACADGRKQRLYINKEDTSSPAIQLESLLLTLMVDAKEQRDVATADISGAYLLADMKDFVLIRLEGESAEIMCKVDPSYKKYRSYNKKGKPILYLQLVKALYGCLQSALRWYETFVCKLEAMGFKINPYDPCVANAEIEGSQCTICWYVDDTKISHVNSEVVSKVRIWKNGSQEG